MRERNFLVRFQSGNSEVEGKDATTPEKRDGSKLMGTRSLPHKREVDLNKQRAKFITRTKKRLTVIMFGKLYLLINVLTTFIVIVHGQQEDDAGKIVTKLCNFEKPLKDPTDELHGRFCDCDVENSPPWGIPVVIIDCQDHHLQNSIFQAENLTQGTVKLDMSYNKFTSIPYFIGEKLKYLSLRDNAIAELKDKNFANITSLLELDLSDNKIELISNDAFVGLELLRKLNLAGNRIKEIQVNTFSMFLHLEHLILSDNPLGEFFNSSENDIFLKVGVTPRLATIELAECGLIDIDLSNGIGLDTIVLRQNQLIQIQRLPKAVSHLDISDNPIRAMTAKFLPNLFNLKSLIMEDMPNLYKLDEYSLYGLPSLSHLNLQGSRNLTIFDPHAFGKNVILNETDIVLEKLILKGTGIRTLNSSLQFAFEQLKVLDLAGTPLNCDCQIRWLKKLNVTTDATICSKPASLRDRRFNDIQISQFQCRVEKSWIYMVFNVMLVILLIILLFVGVYLVYIAIRPRQQVQLRKVGTNSPYARVTIEPNHAENFY
ncbi:leucine-rich repeat neuronal protein 3-like [Malaya genurostris]|uniref:leucine-rich repeat neuronal protein 3-like n=1 Tax=Malaya genurostris TaxID=325434 RepID=UPI0026F400CA|nr:leucine-rich repeat neuronal protein 3-like [Malaya genurostris]